MMTSAFNPFPNKAFVCDRLQMTQTMALALAGLKTFREKKKNAGFTAFAPLFFSHQVLKILFLQGGKNPGLFGKGL